MTWYKACVNPERVTNLFETVPNLDCFEFEYFEYVTAAQIFMGGEIDFLPDHHVDKEGFQAKQTLIEFGILDSKSVELIGGSNSAPGRLHFTRIGEGLVEGRYAGPCFQMLLQAEQAVIANLRPIPVPVPGFEPPKPPRLIGHHSVWNSCLLLAEKLGYTLKLRGRLDDRIVPMGLSWQAFAKDGTKLSASDPLELLGLITLHQNLEPPVDNTYNWRLDGPNMVSRLDQEFREFLGR